MKKRVVIKLSGEALGGGSGAEGSGGSKFSDAVILKIVSQISTVLNQGVQVSLVVGGGNFWRNKSNNVSGNFFTLDRSKSDQMGMLGTVMNGLYLSEAFKAKGIAAEVFTPFVVGSLTKLFSKDEAEKSLNSGTVVINAAGTGHPFFTTDSITALRAAELHADFALYAKNIDGVYDSDPSLNPKARKLKSISYKEAVYKNLNAIDIAAMTISMEAGTPSLIFGLDEQDSIIHACSDDMCNGTTITMNAKEEYYV